MTAAAGSGQPAAGSPSAVPAVGVVILTQGTRPRQLQLAVASALAQQGVDVDCVVVGNGWEPAGLPRQVRTVAFQTNVGIPAGRNRGISVVRGDPVFLLDDDAALPDPHTLARLAAVFTQDSTIGIVQLRIVDPSGAESPRRYVPRLRTGDPARSSDVTTFCEGAAAIRRSVFDEAGLFTEAFWYAHEGTDLAWRALDAGYRVYYLGEVVAHHPATQPTRHEQFHYLSARNRVWLARRHLPLPLALLYPVVWFLLTLVRLRDAAALTQVLRGYWHGVVKPCGTRRPMRWRTVWRMTRTGRPPIV
ncbi:MAG: glycosyltransferase [Nitriliruptorales bacterium]|nr:glycosyltransferase [Nitriliruptorales bacterium]